MKSMLTLGLCAVFLTSCTSENTAPVMRNDESQKIQKALTSAGMHSVAVLLAERDRAVCVLGQAGGYSKIDRYGYLQSIEKLKFPWIHGFLSKIGVTTDWYWTLVIFDEKNQPRALKIDRGGTVDLTYETKELCFGAQDFFVVQVSADKKISPSFVTFK